MKLIYKGKFNGNPDSLPHGKHKEGAVKFKEIDDPKKLGLIMNVLSIFLLIFLEGLCAIRSGIVFNVFGALLALLSMFPHEFLHAICFKKEVYLYTNWKQGMLFVIGCEDMSKTRFIFLSLLPNFVFGIIPLCIYFINPQYSILGTLGVFATTMGIGDYYNVFNALTQMPKGARTYLYKFNSYWYIP